MHWPDNAHSRSEEKTIEKDTIWSPSRNSFSSQIISLISSSSFNPLMVGEIFPCWHPYWSFTSSYSCVSLLCQCLSHYHHEKKDERYSQVDTARLCWYFFFSRWCKRISYQTQHTKKKKKKNVVQNKSNNAASQLGCRTLGLSSNKFHSIVLNILLRLGSIR